MDIWDAALHGNIRKIRELLDQGVNINSKNEHGVTPLHIAASNSNSTSSLETVRFLLENGADPNIKKDYGNTALMEAAVNSNGTSSLETVRLLLENGADPNNKNVAGFTALLFAASNSDTRSSLETVRLLLENGADPFVSSPYSTLESKEIIDEARWVRLSARDKQLAEKYNRDIPISKDVWLIIMRHKRQQQLCSNLGSEKNKELLKYFALELEIPLEEIRDLTKAQLCGIISRQLTYRQFDRIKTEKRSDKLKIIEVASRYGIDTTKPFNEIMNNLAKIF